MDEYYARQAGSGLGGFAGVRYQKGDGFFGRMMSGTVLPIIKRVLPYLGKTVLNTASDIFGDVSQGEKFKESFKRRFKDTAGQVGEDALSKMKQLTGAGRRRRRRKKCSPPKRKAKIPKKKRPTKKKGRKRKARTTKKKAFDFL